MHDERMRRTPLLAVATVLACSSTSADSSQPPPAAPIADDCVHEACPLAFENTEYKFVLTPDAYDTAKERLRTWMVTNGLEEKTKKCRWVNFYDDAAQSLAKAKVRLRTRGTSGKLDGPGCTKEPKKWDVMLKWGYGDDAWTRALQRDHQLRTQLGEEHLKAKSKSEIDETLAQKGQSVRLSVSAKLEDKTSKQIAEAERELLKLADSNIAVDQLRPLCPKPVHEVRTKWTAKGDESQPSFTLSRWTYGDAHAVELSFVVPTNEPQNKRLDELRQLMGTLVADEPSTKTQWLVAQCRQHPAADAG